MAIDPKSREFFLRSDYAILFGVLSGLLILAAPKTKNWLMLSSAPLGIYVAGALLSGLVIGIVRLRSVFGFVFFRLRYHCCKCHAVGEPLFKCRHCGELLGAVAPSNMGGFEVRCTCGQTIPTLNINGRLKRTIKVCRECKQEMHSEATGRVPEYVIAIAGAVSSGKSTLFAAILQSLETTIATEANVAVNFEDAAQELDFRAALANLSNRRKLRPTTSFRPEAVSVSLFRNFRRLALLHFVDTRGEDYDSSNRITELIYHGQLDAAVFVLDPLSEKPFLKCRKISDVESSQASAANRSSIEILENFIRGLEANGFGAHSRFDVSLAVVIAKCDVFTNDLSQITSLCTEDLLRDAELENFAKLASAKFSSVRYFPISVIHTKTATKQEYNPIGVEFPTRFLLNACRALAPVKSLRRLLENARRSFVRSVRGQEGRLAWGLSIGFVFFAVLCVLFIAGILLSALGFLTP